MNFKRILVAVDQSPQASAVFEQALSLAKKDAATLMIFNGIELAAKRSYVIEIEEKTAEAKKIVESYQQKANDQGILAEVNYQSGEAGKSICNLAASWDADLIIVGRRGYKGLAAVLLGSVSNYVVYHAPCSVLVIQGEDCK